jgi:hypothetical protein
MWEQNKIVALHKMKRENGDTIVSFYYYQVMNLLPVAFHFLLEQSKLKGLLMTVGTGTPSLVGE